LETVFRWIAILVIAFASLAAPTAPAQESPDPGTESGGAAEAEVETPVVPPPTGIEAIEVTGERADGTDVQDEAQAISAFSADDLAKANIVNMESLQFNVPGLHVGLSGQQAIVTLRGVGTENATITGEPGVAFHVDGVNYAQPAAARLAFFDLESLDVKRGPQGLEGGKNSTSGTINVITRKPHDEYEVTGDFLMGNYDRRRARGAINVPLSELAAFRTAVYYEDRDGFLDNAYRGDERDAFDADDFGFRTHLNLTPVDSLEVLLSYNYFRQGGVGPQADIAPFPRVHLCGFPTVPTPSVLPALAACGQPPGILPATEDGDPRKVYLGFPSSQKTQFWGWTATVQWDVPELPLLGATQLKGIGGFQQSDVDFLQDFDATDQVMHDFFNGTDQDISAYDNAQKVHQHTAELQWSGAAGGERLEWQAGGYFARERGGRDLEVTNALAEFPVQTTQDTENVAWGAFLHTLLHVTENVRFDLGGRWIKDEKATNLFTYNGDLRTLHPNRTFVGCDGTLGFSGSFTPIEVAPWCERTYRGRMWGAGLNWRPFGGDHLLYAKLDRGYKSGGFRAGRRGEYLPEKIWAYAAGTKSEFFDARLQLNIEGFAYNYQDMQLVVLDGTTVRTENADTRMYGWDLEARAAPIEGLDLGVVVSFLKTEVLDYKTLDPADTRFFPGDISKVPSGRFDPYGWVQTYNEQRLNQREAAEDETEDEAPRTYAQQSCYPSPDSVSRASEFQLPDDPCGTVTRFGGLDDFSGNELSRAPKWKYTLSAGYDIPVGRFGTLTPRVQYTWQDDTYFRVFNRPFDLQEDYHLTDVKLEWRSPEERWSAEVFVQNIEDEAPKQNVFVGPRIAGAPPLAWYGPPRFYGVQVGFRY
jgi:iron complex outermembrane receptor protein